MKVKNETVYVIYFDGKPYEAYGRKIAYVSKGAAKGVVSGDMNDMLRREYEKVAGKNYYGDRNKELLDRLESELSERFKIVEYGPKKEEIV